MCDRGSGVEAMASAGSRVLADIFEYAKAGDWLTMEHASAVYRAMCDVRAE
jgi:hypothetical protein